MDLNTAATEQLVRQVVGRLLVNGTQVPFDSFDVDSNAFYSADTFSVVLPFSALPPPYNTIAWWASQTSIDVSISAGLINQGAQDWKELIVGAVDHLSIRPARFEVAISGRDYTSRFIDHKTNEKFANMTTSEVATLLATRRGLTPVVTATTTQVGRITKWDHAHVTDERTEWDLLAYFAGMDGFQVYVSGSELHYEPALDPQTTDQYLIRWTEPNAYHYPQSNTTDDITFERDLTLALGVTVQVISWKDGKTVKATYPNNSAKGISPGQSTSKRQVYEIKRSGLDQNQAQQLAQRTHKQITDHEMRMSCSMPADNLLMPNTIVRQEGTSSQFDQLYYVDSVRRSMSFAGGYTMSLTAKNHNPNSLVQP
ncbi:rhs element Vgr protein [Pseudomonas fluorescens]|uniref:rhs element Vgr protein n=1 Tax=Pseudomonas fluorescens TaxID=294 RepID=UPI00165576F9|nr:rhs element Vgr protein [Pseudomonas fluorescens]MBC8786513.1 rhs element Vgr protein [Pseudomonas fluorescens]